MEYAIKYYETTREELNTARRLVSDLGKSAYNKDTLMEVALARDAYDVEESLFNIGVNKYMFRRDLDEYVSNPQNGVTLRPISDYNRLVPAPVLKAVSVLNKMNGQALVLSFNDEVVVNKPEIHNSLLADSKGTQHRDESVSGRLGERIVPQPAVTISASPKKSNSSSETRTISHVSTRRRSIDPIVFGIIRSATGRVWEKVWILGAWLNNYPTLTTSESIIAALSNFSKGNTVELMRNELELGNKFALAGED